MCEVIEFGGIRIKVNCNGQEVIISTDGGDTNEPEFLMAFSIPTHIFVEKFTEALEEVKKALDKNARIEEALKNNDLVKIAEILKAPLFMVRAAHTAGTLRGILQLTKVHK